MIHALRRSILAITMLALAACGSPTPPPQAIDWQHGGKSDRPLSAPVKYVAYHATWKKEARDSYAEATRYVEARSAELGEGEWAVVMDLDQTVLNNIAYHIAQDGAGAQFTPETWRSWVEEREATLVPGAKEFIDRVNVLGGHVVFVTNRRDYEAAATVENLATRGIVEGRDYTALLTRLWPDMPSDKESRFASVPPLLDGLGYTRSETIAYIGDVVGDRPALLGSAKFFCIPQGGLYGENCKRTAN
jgi:5'-nucleotidase (lipoprotein e(P4) family)